MATATTIDRDWVATQFAKGIEAEQDLASTAKTRAEAPPNPSMAVLYHEIASADERHARSVETIAIRYGHTPSKGATGGLGETLGRIRDKVTSSVISTSAPELVGHDLAVKANAIHWYTAWIHAFERIGDTESARELAAILTEERAHLDALQNGLNRLVETGARGEPASNLT